MPNNNKKKLKQTAVGFGSFFWRKPGMPSTFEKYTCPAEVWVTDLFIFF